MVLVFDEIVCQWASKKSSKLIVPCHPLSKVHSRIQVELKIPTQSYNENLRICMTDMSAVLTRCRVSSEQLDLLLSFMEEHPEFAAGKQSVYSRFSSSKLWRLLAERLNAAAVDSGGARKSPDKWCRYWADIKYKARKKSAAGGALGDLSSAEERLQNIFNSSGRESGSGRRASHSDDERKPLDDDMCSEGSAPAPEPRLATEELLAEAAMRSALAAEKQAEAVAQAVELLRELLALLRERPPAQHAHELLQPLQHHHHRL